MAVRPFTDMDHLIMRYFVAETGRGFGVIKMPPIIGRGFFLFFDMGEKQYRMEMRPALFLAVFTCDEIPNFVTRTSKQLNKKLKVARLEQLVREIIAGRIGQVNHTGVRADRRLCETPANVIVDPVSVTAPAATTADRLFFPLRAALHPDIAWVDTHIFSSPSMRVTKRISLSRNGGARVRFLVEVVNSKSQRGARIHRQADADVEAGRKKRPARGCGRPD